MGNSLFLSLVHLIMHNGVPSSFLASYMYLSARWMMDSGVSPSWTAVIPTLMVMWRGWLSWWMKACSTCAGTGWQWG